jgi:hydrogenase maturation factor
MSKIDEEEAALALASLQLMGKAYDEELEAFWSSQVASGTGGG